MQNARRSVVNSTTRADKHSGAADREMGLGVSTSSSSHNDKGVALSQSSGSSIDSDQSSRVRENEFMTESDDDNSEDEIERSESKGFECTGPSLWETNSWFRFRDIREATGFLNLSNDCLKDLQDRKLSQVVDTLQEFLCNTRKKLESEPQDGCPESQNELSRQIKTIVLLRNFLKKACDEKDFDAIELVWRHLMDDHTRHETSENLLYAAAERGLVGLCECLIEMGISANGRHLNNYTPLMGACRSGHLDVVQLLCANHGDLSLKAKDGDTALHIASKAGHEKVVQFLVLQKANLEAVNKAGYTPLMEAISEGHLAVVSDLIRLGANSALQVEVSKETGAKETPLSLAASKGHLDIVKFLVEHCAVQNQLHDALMKAAFPGHLDVGRYLIEAGAEVERQKGCMESPLLIASQEGHLEFVELLLNNNANIEETGDGYTPLLMATLKNNPYMVEFLISKGANVNAAIKTGEDALMQASKGGFVQVVELLLRHGANVLKETDAGRTALMFASKFCHPCIAQLLINKGADVNKSTKNNDETILSSACCIGNLQMVQLLVKHGANPHYRLQDGSTMLIEAVRGGHAEIVKLLFHLTTDSSSSCSSQDEHDEWGSGHLDEPEWSSDVQSRSPSVPQLNVSPTHSTVSNDLAIASTVAEEEPAFDAKAESCSEDSDDAEDESVHKKIRSPFFKKSLQVQQTHCQQHSKLKFDQFKKQCLRQHVHTRHRRSSLSSDSSTNNWKHVVAASQTSQKVEKRLRSGLVSSSPKPLLVEQKLYKGGSACEACGCCPATSVEELDKKSLQLLQKSLMKATNVEHAEIFDGHEKFNCPSCFISPQEKIPSTFQPYGGEQNAIQCQTLSSTTAQQHLAVDSQSSLQDQPHDFLSHSSMFYQPSSFNIDAQMEGSQETALTIACSKGFLNVVRMLVTNGANLEHKDKKGFTPLIHAANSGHDAIVDLLLNEGSKIEAEAERTKDTALSLACVNGHIKAIDLLLARGANKEHRNGSDYSPLCQAASIGNTEAIELLLHYGAEINARTNAKLGISPLMLAATNGHTQAVRLLLERGGDVNAIIENNKNTALTLASFQGHHEIVSLLLDHKANIEHRTKSGCTAMMEAAQGGHMEVAKVLLDRGADVGNFRDTSLSIAAEKGHCKFVELLLTRHAPIDLKNKKGTTPLWMACYAGHVDVVKALVLSGADADATDGRKVSCLVAALRKGHVKVVRFLVNHVAQLPPDPEIQKYQSSTEESNDPDLAAQCLECIEIIRKTKEAQEMKAYKNAAILLDELQQEKKMEAKKRAAREKKREKRKQKKKEKVASSSKSLESEPKCATSSNQETKLGSGSAASDEESSHRSVSDDEVVEKENNPGKMIEQISSIKKKPSQREVPESIEQGSPLKDFGCAVSTSASVSGMPLQESKTQANNKCQELIKNESSFLKSKLSSIGDLDDFALLPQANVVVAPVLVSTPSTQKMKPDHKVTPKVASDALRDSNPPKVITSTATRASSQTSSSMTKAVTIVTASHPTLSTIKPPVTTVSSAAGNLKTFSKKKTASVGQSSSLKKDDPQTFYINSKDSYKKMKKIDVPARAVSRVIGRAGCNINAIREFSGAKIDLDKVKYSDDAVVTIRGTNDGVSKAAELIQALIRESDKDIEQLITAFKQQQSTGTVFSNDVPVTTNAWKTGNASLALKNSLPVPSSFPGVSVAPSMIPTSNVWENRKIQTALADQNKASTNAWLKPQVGNKDVVKSSTAPSSNVWDNSMADGVGKVAGESQPCDISDEKPEPITTFPIGAWKSVSKTSRERSPNTIPATESAETNPMTNQTVVSKEGSEWFQQSALASTFTTNISAMAVSSATSSNAYPSFRSSVEQPSTPTYSTITGSRSMTGEYSPFGAGLFGSSIFGNQSNSQLTNPVGSSSDISADKSKAPGYRPPSFQARSQTPPSMATFHSRASIIPESLQAFNIDLNDQYNESHKFQNVMEQQDSSSSSSAAHGGLAALLQSPKEKTRGLDSDGHNQNTPSSRALALPIKIISNLNPNAPNFHSRPMQMSPQDILKTHLSSMYKSNVNLMVGQSTDTHALQKPLQSFQNSTAVETNSPYKSYAGDLGIGFSPQLNNQPFYEFSSPRFSGGEENSGSNGINDPSGCEGRMREAETTLHPYASSTLRSTEPRKQTRLQPIGTERNNKKQQIMNSAGMPTPTSALTSASQNLTSNPNPNNMMINLQQGIGNLSSWSYTNASSLFRSPSANPAQDSHLVEPSSAFASNPSSFNLDTGFRSHTMAHHIPSLFDQSSAGMMPIGSYVMPNGSNVASNSSYSERLTPQHFQHHPNSNPVFYHHHHQSSSFSRVPQDLDAWQLNQTQPSVDLNDSQLWGMWPMQDRN